MAKKGRKTECVSYLRVSGDGQINGDGPDRQREANESYAKANGLRIDFEAFDAGVSGVCDMENRDELPRLGLRRTELDQGAWWRMRHGSAAS